MAAHYALFTLNELSGAMESIDSASFEGESLVFSPVSEQACESGLAD
jgi:hypothetical protein